MQAPAENTRKWQILTAVAFGSFMSTVDASIVNIALPTFMRAFDADFANVQWVVLSYMLVVVTLIPSVGRLGDIFGKKPLYMAGFALFTAASAACGSSSSLNWLLVARVLQGVGAAITNALGLAIVAEAFPANQRGRALGITGAVVSVGLITGPSLGGIILSAASWHWIFLINVPIGIIGMFLVQRSLTHQPRGGVKRFDLIGAMFLGATLLCFLLGMTEGERQGFSSGPAAALMVAAAILLPAFVAWEMRVPEPMIDLTLFRHGAFATNLAAGFLCFFSMSGLLLLTPFYLQQDLGYSTREAGLFLAVSPVVVGLVAPFAGYLSDKLGSTAITRLGLTVLTFGLWAVGTLSLDTRGASYIIRFVLVGLGMGLFQSPNNSAIMGAAPRDRLGIASSLMVISRTLGQVTGAGVMGALWNWRVAERGFNAASAQAGRADPVIQVAAFDDVAKVAACLAFVALLLNWRGARTRHATLAPTS